MVSTRRTNQQLKRNKSPAKKTMEPPRATQVQAIQPAISPQAKTKEKDTLETNLQKIYQDVRSTPSFSAKITDFLRKNHIHSVHRRIVKRKFPRRKVIARFPFELFMADLIEYPNDKFVNNGYCYILVLIDCFTKMIYAEPMKKKNSEWTADALDTIFKTFDRFPVNFVTDGGLEFFNSRVQKVFQNFGINHYRPPT